MTKAKKLTGVLSLIIILLTITGCKNEYKYLSIKDKTDFNFPLDSQEEAIIYSNSIQEFTDFRNKLRKDSDWIISAEYLTEKEHKELFESWYKSGKIDVEEYQRRIEWSRTEGDYWNVNWRLGLAVCDIQFRNDGKLKNITGAGRGDKPFNCGYEGK